MKVLIEKIDEGIEEAIIRTRKMTPDIRKAVALLEHNTKQIVAKSRGEKIFVNQQEILYFESVNEKVFAYTRESEMQTEYTLNELEGMLGQDGFFRCSKAFIVNLDKIVSLRSEMGNRIDAKLENGEHLIISRRYAKELRAILKEGRP
ncbi:MAG: LytTR family DNA-binding domain-containing protein [Lachnospiraceae bacterium]|nr:LytTR family transcriptional regulator DNA-binding domain-containing protein [Agathobacter sp.]MDD6290253.1 LytTR family DNA-binding domain-containing protein [Lachnospiraceae bacterium]